MTVSYSDYILFDGATIYEYWNKKDNWDTILDVTYRNEGNKKNRNVPVQFWTGHFPNTNYKGYRLNQLVPYRF